MAGRRCSTCKGPEMRTGRGSLSCVCSFGCGLGPGGRGWSGVQRPGDAGCWALCGELGLCPVESLWGLRLVSLWWDKDLVCLSLVSPGPVLSVAQRTFGK